MSSPPNSRTAKKIDTTITGAPIPKASRHLSFAVAPTPWKYNPLTVLASACFLGLVYYKWYHWPAFPPTEAERAEVRRKISEAQSRKRLPVSSSSA
ncbi:hypothetical protein BV898_14478 [Hypsibius exemplaris]|uniref:Uncharacterized protein n=1 Tax=Hypsibius exemplaris TaxID=2072580 RepID=A0A9X6NIB7_HYPEX|nr:hypothetical protein BV898_14478 [Hypsibius exemplaris]